MFNLFHRPRFDPTKTKVDLRMAVSRLRLHQQKYEMSIREQRKAIAELLAKQKDESARIKVEGLIRDGNLVEAMEIIALYCDLLAQRIQLIAEHRDCPPDVKQAAMTIVWVTPRLESVPELLSVRHQMELKYGPQWIQVATTNSENAVNEQIMRLVSVAVPEPYLCLTKLEGIAKEFRLEWRPMPTATPGLPPAFSPPPPPPPPGFGPPPAAPPHSGGGGGGGYAVDPRAFAAPAPAPAYQPGPPVGAYPAADFAYPPAPEVPPPHAAGGFGTHSPAAGGAGLGALLPDPTKEAGIAYPAPPPPAAAAFPPPPTTAPPAAGGGGLGGDFDDLEKRLAALKQSRPP